jgi:hypothetical protein
MNAVLAAVLAMLIVPAMIGGAIVLKRKDGEPTTAIRNRAAGSSWGSKKVADRRALWARRYGAGTAWTAGAVGLSGIAPIDGVGDPHGRCSGHAGLTCGGCGGGLGDIGSCGGGVGCGGCGGGGGGCGGGS